jgi:carboxyl-terminal processing protease
MKKSFFIVIALLVAWLGAQAQIKINSSTPLNKLNMAVMAINNLYVEDVDQEKLTEDAIKGMLEKLDPHSTYSNAKETKQLNESLEGSFEGIGVQFNMMEDTLVVIQTISNGPSEKVGIIPGDRIVMVNDTAIAGVNMSKEDIMS